MIDTRACIIKTQMLLTDGFQGTSKQPVNTGLLSEAIPIRIKKKDFHPMSKPLHPKDTHHYCKDGIFVFKRYSKNILKNTKQQYRNSLLNANRAKVELTQTVTLKLYGTCFTRLLNNSASPQQERKSLEMS